jgi:aspartate/methionine/tyrosine aminotransferase
VSRECGLLRQSCGERAAGKQTRGRQHRPTFNSEWYLQQIFEIRQLPFKPGAAGCPTTGCTKKACAAACARWPAARWSCPATATRWACRSCALTAQNLQQELSIVANPAQLMLTHGASQALDLAVRTLVRPGDVVLVDDPGYPNLMSILRTQGATLVGVPRTPAGYDLDHLERLLAHHQPTAFFTQPHLHSPTCSRTPLPQLHRLLQLASQHGFRLVENNLYADMVTEPLPCLASLDHLQQVVYVGSYSKSISPNVRVGYLLANPELMQQLLHLKMRSGLTTSQVMERVVYAAIIDGRWRKHLKRLRQRLAEAHQEVGRHLHRLGFELFIESDEGMYIWTRHPAIPDSAALLDDALEKGIMLGPGQLFMVDAKATGWMRFNVAFSTDPAMWELLEKVLVKHVRRAEFEPASRSSPAVLLPPHLTHAMRQGWQPWPNRFGTLQQMWGGFTREAPRGRRSISLTLHLSRQTPCRPMGRQAPLLPNQCAKPSSASSSNALAMALR